MAQQMVFRVTFFNRGEVYEVYAHEVGPAGMPGFIEVGGLLFGERTEMVVDPSEERLQSEFKDVSRFFLPLHAVVRIDEVAQAGPGRITAEPEGNVTPFPTAPYSPPGDK